MSRQPRAWLWAALGWLALSVACERGAAEPPPPAATPASGAPMAQATQALGAVTCTGVEPISMVPGWMVAAVQSAGGPAATGSFGAKAGERALLVVRETSGAPSETFRAAVKLNGLDQVSLVGSASLAARVVELSTFNLLELSVLGSGAAQTSVASLSTVPCSAVEARVSSRGGKFPTVETREFTWPAGVGKGVLVVESGGAANVSGRVWVGAQEVQVPAFTQPPLAVLVAPMASDVLRIEVVGGIGGWVRAVVMNPDMTPPTVSLVKPVEGAVLSFSPVQVEGTAGAGAVAVKVAGKEATLEQGRYSVGVPVQEGPNALIAEAKDVCGHVARACRSVRLDAQPPRITFEQVSEGQLSREPLIPIWRVESSGLASMEATLDGTPFLMGASVSAEGAHELVVVATDSAGRQSQARLGFGIDTTPPRITLEGVEEGARRNTPVVLGFSVEEEHPGSVEATLDGAPVAAGDSVGTEGAHELVVVATDAAGNTSEARRHFVVDLTPPTLQVLSPAPGLFTQAGSLEVEVAVVEEGPVAGVLVGGAELALGEDGRYRGTVTLAEGSNLLVVLARDVAGNTAQETLQVTRDSTPPQVSITTPAEGAKVAGDSVQVEGLAEDATALTVRIAGLAAAVGPDGRFQLSVAVAQGPVSLEVEATDAAGNTSRLRRSFRANATPPRLELSAPASGSTTEKPSIEVSGFARAADKTDTVKLEVAGGEHSVRADGSFTVEVPLAPGLNTVSIVAVDGYGLRTTRTVTVEREGPPEPGDGGSGGGPGDGGGGAADAGSPGPDGGTPEVPPVLVLAAPQEGSLWGTERVGVLGRVEGGTLPLEVTVEGLPASVVGRQFSASLALPEGAISLRVRAVDAVGRVAEARRQVRVDRTPPFLDVTRPEAPLSTVSESPYLVEGLAGDAYLGGVTVNGVPAQVLAGSFSAAVPLSSGDNVVQVEATDLAGNRARVTRTLRVSGLPPRLIVLEPSEGSEARQPVVRVAVKVESSVSLEEVSIGTGEATAAGAGVYTAQVPLALGENVIAIRARDTLGLTGTASVRVRYRDPSTEPLVVTGVDPADESTELEPDTLVNVAFNKAVRPDSVRTRFTVRAGGEPLPGGWSVAPGGQTVSFIARDPLPEGATLEVRVAEVEPVVGPGMEGEFRSAFTVRRPLTRLRGQVVDERREPLAGVRVEVEGQDRYTRTSADGNWALFSVPPGPVVLRYEGGPSSEGRAYPTVRRTFAVEAERDNVDSLLMLTPVDAESAEPVDASAPLHLTFGGRHGALELNIPAGGLTFAGGSARGMVTATELPLHALPVPVDGPLRPAATWQLQPAGTRLVAPAELRLPNRLHMPAGDRALLFAYDPDEHLLRVASLATVSEDGTQLVSDAPVEAGSLEYFGYLPLPEEATLALAGVSFPSGSLAAPLRRSPADGFVRTLNQGWGMTPDSVLFFWEYYINWLHAVVVSGTIRGPREQAVAIDIPSPPIGVEQRVTLDERLQYRMPLSAKARTLIPLPEGARPEPLVLTVEGVGPGGERLGPPSGGSWRRESPAGLNAELSTEVELSLGSSGVFAAGTTPRGRNVVRLNAELSVLDGGIPDGGSTPGVLRVTRADGGSSGVAENEGLVRFGGLPVKISSGMFEGAAYSNPTGRYAGGVMVARSLLFPHPLVQACVPLPIAYQINGYMEGGRVVTRKIPSTREECSPQWDAWGLSLPPLVDVVIDVRWLHGSVTLVDREGQPLPPACGEAEREGSEVVGLSQDDVRTTEVHFFREDDPSTPLVSYAAVDPSPCGGGSTAPHGRYAKVRYGPSTLDSRFGQSRRNLQRLVPGDRLVVFAINHATGHTGMEVLTVPSVNFSSRAPDGSCPADDAAGGPQPVTDGERTVHLSRCTLQDLGIQANIKLYPPEIDVRVDRRARAEGTPQGDMEPSFVRHGGAATTRDDFVRVATHWRVRRGPASSWDAGVLPPADPSCDGGVQQDGGFCAPQPLYDEGQRGRLLERYCAELPEPRTPEQQALCLRDDSLLAEVPAGVPPLAGRVVRITGSAAEEPAVASFHISPGRSTAAVQTSLRQVDRDGREVVLNNLVSANYYVQVVGHPVLPRDRNRDGTIDPSEENAPPPDFADGEDAPGLPDKAVALKNVYRSLEPQGRMERYDRAREHEFRVLKVEGPGEVTAITDRGEARPLPRPGEPPSSAAASPEDVAYQFLLHLMEPEDPGRAGTLSGKYVLRLGSDSFGIECPIELDEAAGTLRGTCEGEYLPEVLSAGDILYLELYLRGNAENVLYRFNFDGLSKREDYLAAASQYTAESAVEKKDGKPVLGRPVSRPGEAHFFLSPQQFSSGRIRLCTNEDCSGSDSLIKEALLQMGSNGRYTVQEVEGGQATARLVQDETPGAAGARRFRQALPATLALMPGARAGAAPSRVFLVKDSVTPLPGHTADQLGHPKGNFQGLHVDAQGQESLMGINLASLSLSFSHTDFKVPQFAKAMSFSRSYDNQSDLISPLGVGWSHSYDGFVVEEELGRYVAVLRGQAWSFLKCAQRNPEAQTASQCETDKSHGMELEVDEQGVHLKSPDGEEYRFDRLAVKRDTEGRRKWLLTKFHDGHGRDGDAGWTQLTYAHGSNRLIQVARTPGALGLELEYEDIPQDAAAAINALARQEDFQFLKKVTLKNGEMTLHAGTFLHDKQGNLLEANGTTGSPSRTWRYTYKEVPANVESAKAWRAVNELSAASLMVGEGTEWSASYERNGAECYQHLEPFECVTRVDASGPSGDSIQVSGTLSERSITMPGGSSARAGLNLYGNVTSFQEQGQNAWTLSWASSVRGQPVRLESMVTSYNLTMDFSHDDKLRLSGVSVRGPTSLTAESLFTVTARQNGLPTGGTMAVAGSQVSWQTPRNASGDMESLRIGSHTLGTWVHDAEGRILQAEDRAGNTWEVTSFGHPLGLPTGVRVTSPAQPGTTQESYAMSTAYDPHGQMTLLANERTGLRQQWTYDGLGRVTGSVQGVPSVPGPGAVQTWSFEYSHSGAQTTLVERMAESGFEQTKVLQEGRLQSQTVSYGGQLATRSYSYEGGRLSQMTDERGAVRSFTYDGAGRLLRVDVDGQLEAAYQWNAQGQATALTDGEGRTVYVEYDGFGRPATVRHSDGQQETVRRDSQGNILWRQLSTPGSEPHTYEYERSELGQLLSVRSEGGASNGVELQTAYDSAGRPVTREDRVTGVTESFEYNDLLGRMTRHVRSIPSGASVLTWDERRVYSDAPGWTDLVIRRTIDTGQGSREEEQRLRLDVRGRVLRSEVPGSGAYEYTYDAQGNMLTERHSVLGLLASYSYDERGQLLSATGADGAATSYLRDASGRVLHQYGPHPEEHWAFEYDSKGRPTRRTLSASGNTPAAIWQLSYPGEGSVYEWDPLGYLTARTLDARGLLLSRVRMASPQPDSQRQCELFAYDGEQVKSRIVRMDSCDPDEATWEARQERTHDARGRVLWEQERWFQGHQEQYTYTTHTSWSGRTASVQQSWVPLGAPARQVAATMELDGLGNMVSRSQGGGTDEWLYDAAGLLVSELPAGRPARLLSYAQGRLMQETYGAEITAYAYDGAGRRQSKTDPSGRVRSWEYDSGGRVASERFGRAGETLTRRYTYEAGGGLKTMQRGEGPEAAVWTFQHGPRRELQSVTLPAAVGAFQFQYDAALQLTAIQPPPGSVTPAQTFAYDFLGRQTRRTRGPSVWTTAWQGGTAIQVDPNEDVVETLLDGRGRTARRIYRPGPSSQEHTDLMQVAAAYDGTDQLMAVTETRHSGSVSHVYEYDARSRLISLQHGDDTVSYSYTEGGQRQSVTSPSGSVQYVYDALGRLGQMNSSQGPAVSMIWEPGGLLSESNGNGVVERYVYSGQGMIRSITAAWGEGPGNSMRHEYDYDTRGNRLEERYTAPGAAALQVTQYGYDLANRLTGVRYSSNDSELYALGVDGSRLEEKRVQGYLGSLGPEGLTTAENPHQYWRYSYDTAGGLLRIDDLVAQPARVEANLTTDPAGRLISEQRGAAARQFHWDGAGRLASVSVTGTESPTTVSYTYAFDGLRRTRTDESGAQVRYVWGVDELLEEGPASGPRARYTEGGRLVVAAGNERLLHDGLGSVVGRAGTPPLLSRYGAWGELREGTAPQPGQPSQAFAELSLDTGARLFYAQQRWYDPVTGRFLSEDPLLAGLASPWNRTASFLAQPMAFHPHTYAATNPVNAVDPTGLYQESIHGALTYYLAIYAGFDWKQAAMIALGNAAVDHDPHTQPVDLGNIVSGVTKDWHFDPAAQSNFEKATPGKSASGDAYREWGRKLHTLMDMGFDQGNARGPHSNGRDYKSDMIGHPMRRHCDGTTGAPWSPSADHPFRDRDMNYNVLAKIFNLLVSQGGNKRVASSKYVEKVIRYAVDMNTREDFKKFIETPPVPGAPSYKEIVAMYEKDWGGKGIDDQWASEAGIFEKIFGSEFNLWKKPYSDDQQKRERQSWPGDQPEPPGDAEGELVLKELKDFDCPSAERVGEPGEQ